MADMILDVDYNITKAEAKQNKLNREFDIGKQKAANIKEQIKATEQNIENSKKQQANLNAELDRSAQKLEAYRHNELNLTDKQLQAELKRNNMLMAQLSKEEGYQKNQETLLAKQNLQYKKQLYTVRNIGENIKSNSNKTVKHGKAWNKAGKDVDRFGRRLKSLIASALFFTLVTKAFTALREEFGKLITETGTKTAALVSKLKGNLATIGQTLYQSAKPYIEWLLQKLVQLTEILAEGLTKILGKDIRQMAELAENAEKTAKASEKATAGFDTLQKIDTSTSEETSTAPSDFSQTKDGELDKETEKLKNKLKQLLPLVITIGGAFTAWKITSLLGQMGVLSGSVTKIIGGILLVAVGFAMLFSAAVNWNDELHNGENTFQAILGTVGAILIVIGLIIAGVTAWPVLLIAAFVIAGMWIDNFKDKIDNWLNSLPAGIYDLMSIFITAAYGVWDFIKNLFKGIYEIFTGDWEKGLKRIGTALVNLLIDALNIVIDGLNFLMYPIRLLIQGIGKIAGKDWNLRDIAVQHIPRIPQLATGAVIPGGSPFLAMLGDQPKGKTNIEAPLETLIEAFKAAQGSNKFTIEATGNMAQLIRLLNLKIKEENKRATMY